MTDADAVRELASLADHFAVLATARPDGGTHASLVKAGLLTDPVTGLPVCGAVIVGGARKLEYLRWSGRASATFSSGGRWISAEGPVRLVGPDDPLPGLSVEGLSLLLRDVFTAAGGVHDDWDTYDRVMAQDRRAAALISLERVTPAR